MAVFVFQQGHLCDDVRRVQGGARTDEAAAKDRDIASRDQAAQIQAKKDEKDRLQQDGQRMNERAAEHA